MRWPSVPKNLSRRAFFSRAAPHDEFVGFTTAAALMGRAAWVWFVVMGDGQGYESTRGGPHRARQPKPLARAVRGGRLLSGSVAKKSHRLLGNFSATGRWGGEEKGDALKQGLAV